MSRKRKPESIQLAEKQKDIQTVEEKEGIAAASEITAAEAEETAALEAATAEEPTETAADPGEPAAETEDETAGSPETPETEIASPAQPEVVAANKKGDVKMIIFGAIVLVFALIGLVSSVIFVTNGISSLIQQESKQEEYEWLVTPIVLQDPPQFESPDEMTDSTIITAGAWRLIMNEDTSKYPIDDMNFITVPASDIEVQIKALFGDVSYTHQTVGDSTLMIMYDEQNHSYIFPAVPHVLAYTPQVQAVEKPEDGTVILTVGYIPPGPVWQGDTEGKRYQPSPEKVMEITLKADENGEWKIYALTSPEGQQPLPEAPSLPSDAEPDGEVSEPTVPAEESVPAESSEPEVSSDGGEGVAE